MKDILRFDNVFLIAASEAGNASTEVEGLENKLRAAMSKTVNHWSLTDENRRFMAAVVGCMAHLDEEDKKRIGDELHNTSVIARAIQSGDLSKLDNLLRENEPIGLLRLWNEATG